MTVAGPPTKAGDPFILRQSDISTWGRCPLKYRYQYIDNYPRLQSGALTFGSIVHDVVMQLELTQDVEAAVALFKKYWAEPTLLDPSYKIDFYLRATNWTKYLDEGERMIRDWWEIIRWESDVVLGREFSFDVPIGDGHVLHGTIDKLAVRQHPKYGRVVLVSDYKTNAKVPTYEWLEDNIQFTAYCRSPEAPVLMADLTWRPIGDLREGDQIMAVDEEPVARPSGARRRHWRAATITKAWRLRKQAYRVTLTDGTQMVVGAGHRLLAQREGSWAWRTVEDIATNLDNPRRKHAGIKVARVIRAPRVIDYDSADYQAGYIAGATLGDGSIRSDANRVPFWQIVLGADDEALLDRLRDYLGRFGVKVIDFVREPDGRGWQRHTMAGLHTRRRGQVEQIQAMCSNHSESDEYAAGWLAGLYDTDGGRSDVSGTISFWQKDVAVLEQVAKRSHQLGFQFRMGVRSAELIGDRSTRAAYMATLRPALDRKVDSLDGHTLRIFDDVRITSVEPLGTQDLVDVTTTTGTYVADGIVNHNCYATTRPEFWANMPNGEHLFNDMKDLPRMGEWVSLRGPKRLDAGLRDQVQYNRLITAANAIAESVAMRIFVPTISGENCKFCDFREHCGLRVIGDDE